MFRKKTLKENDSSSDLQLYYKPSTNTEHLSTKSSCSDLSTKSARSSVCHQRYMDVDLAKVFKVTRLYSCWKTCRSFHRILTVVEPIIKHSVVTTVTTSSSSSFSSSLEVRLKKSQNIDTSRFQNIDCFQKKIFAQYVWRSTKPADKLRVYEEIKQITKSKEKVKKKHES